MTARVIRGAGLTSGGYLFAQVLNLGVYVVLSMLLDPVDFGRYASATVRGTTWLVQDTCTSTLTRVKKGTVAVNDFVKHKTVLLRAPRSYTARRKGR